MADEVIDRAYVEVLPKVDRFASQTSAEVKQALSGSGRDIEKSVKKSTDGVKKEVTGVATHVKRSFGGMGTAIAGAFAGVGAVKFLGDSITAASDLGETTSKVQQIFGTAAKDILAFSKNSATALGQTQQAALDANATFGIFAKSAGLQGPALTDFTTQLTTLSSDLASFNNTSPEEAIEAIGAALRGESEPIRRYGVLIDDASTRQEAMRLGIIKTTKNALTPQQRVLAVQSLIMKQTSTAQGDFARTSGGLANQQRILAAQFNSLKVTIGNALLPVVLRFVTFLNGSLIPGIRTFLAQMKSGTGAGGVFVDVLKTIATALVSTGVTLFRIGKALFEVGKFIYDNKVAFGVLGAAILAVFAPAIATIVLFNAQMAFFVGKALLAAKVTKIWAGVQAVFNFIMSANPIGLVVIAIGALVAGIIYAYKHSEKFREIVSKAFEAVKRAGASIVAWFKALPGTIRDAIGNAGGFLVQKGKDLLTGLWNGIKSAASAVIGFFRGLAAGVARWIAEGSPAAKMVKAGADFIIGLGKGIYTTIRGLITFFGKLGSSVIRWIGSTARTLYKTGVDLIGGFISGIGRKLFDAATVFGRLAGRVLIWIGNLTRTLWQKGADLIAGLLTGAGRKIIDFGRWIGGIAGRVLTWIGNLNATLTQKGSDLIGGFLTGVLNRMRNISSWVNDHIVKPIVDAVKKFFGIHSPSTVFEGLGRFMVEGLFKGLAQGDKLKVISKIFGGMPHALAAMVKKGIIGISGLPQKALDALGSIGGLLGPSDVTIPTEIIKNFGTRIQYQGETLDLSTYQALMRAVRETGGLFRIMQGSYSTRVAASGGTHAGGGVFDSDADGVSWSAAVNALRRVGFAAWHRRPSQGPWNDHIHAVQIGNPNLSPQAQGQVQSYLAGGDGLAGYAKGAWKLLTDHLAMVHRGEMVVPAGPAEQIRRVIGNSNGRAAGTANTTTVVHNTYIIQAPNYVGDKDDLVKALDQLNRRGRLPAPLGRSA